jgi:xanthine dehydrogenase accessory factor
VCHAGELLARLHSPIGLDLGGSTPEETAISILAEVIADRTAASRRPLRAPDGAIRSRAAG